MTRLHDSHPGRVLALRRGRYVPRQIYIYPDASGDSRKSNNASATDIAQLKQAGFNVW
jgi:hypothetical protein